MSAGAVASCALGGSAIYLVTHDGGGSLFAGIGAFLLVEAGLASAFLPAAPIPPNRLLKWGVLFAIGGGLISGAYWFLRGAFAK